MRKAYIAVVATALIAALGATGAANAGVEQVYAPKDCTKPKVEPKRITLACGDANTYLKRLSWESWGDSKAKGHGKLFVNNCDPNCASGTFDKYDVKVRLLNIKTTTCKGVSLPMYQRAHIRFRGEAPDNAGDLRSFKLACNA